LIDLSIFT